MVLITFWKPQLFADQNLPKIYPSPSGNFLNNWSCQCMGHISYQQYFSSAWKILSRSLKRFLRQFNVHSSTKVLLCLCSFLPILNLQIMFQYVLFEDWEPLSLLLFFIKSLPLSVRSVTQFFLSPIHIYSKPSGLSSKSFYKCRCLVVKVLDSQSRFSVFKTTGWLQGWLTLSSFRGW